MMHKTWSGTEEVPYYFSRSFVKFKGYRGQKIYDLHRFERFWMKIPIWINWQLWNNTHSFYLWAWMGFPIVSRGHLSNFKATRAEKSIWISFEITRPVAAIKSRRSKIKAICDELLCVMPIIYLIVSQHMVQQLAFYDQMIALRSCCNSWTVTLPKITMIPRAVMGCLVARQYPPVVNYNVEMKIIQYQNQYLCPRFIYAFSMWINSHIYCICSDWVLSRWRTKLGFAGHHF